MTLLSLASYWEPILKEPVYLFCRKIFLYNGMSHYTWASPYKESFVCIYLAFWQAIS